jgi:diadenylate cyclase
VGQAILQFLRSVGLGDLLDVTLVAVCIYFVLRTIQKTRAVQIIQGIGVILLLLMMAHVFALQTLSYILNWFLVSLAVVLPIIFQPELRRALMHLGQQGILSGPSVGRMDRQELGKLIDDLAYVAGHLSTLRHGALIVLEQEAGLEDFIERGTRLDSLVEPKLLQGLFHPKTPLHDGAVIIRASRIVAAGCTLDLSSQSVDAKFGTRHRAALGVSEQTDCVVLVVSEESGEIRIVHDGNFSRPMRDEGEVKAQLSRYLAVDGKEGARLRLPLRPGAGRGQS